MSTIQYAYTVSFSFLVWFDRSCSHVACFFIILFSFFADLDFTTQSQWRCLACLFCLLRFFFIVRLCVTFFWSGTMIVSLLPGHSLFPFHYFFSRPSDAMHFPSVDIFVYCNATAMLAFLLSDIISFAQCRTLLYVTCHILVLCFFRWT